MNCNVFVLNIDKLFPSRIQIFLHSFSYFFLRCLVFQFQWMHMIPFVKSAEMDEFTDRRRFWIKNIKCCVCNKLLISNDYTDGTMVWPTFLRIDEFLFHTSSPVPKWLEHCSLNFKFIRCKLLIVHIFFNLIVKNNDT